MTTISMKQVSKSFSRRSGGGGAAELEVLRDVTLDVRSREFLCLLGVSGSGKSTILNLLCGLDRANTGEISFDGRPLLPRERPPVQLGYVFQGARLLPWATILTNVRFALVNADLADKDKDNRARDWIERVGLRGFENAYPHELSGGMQQRASIARSFATNPDVLFMDEPFSSLDEFTGRQLREELLMLWRDTSTTIIFVTHHCFEACFLADRIVLLGSRPGRIVEEWSVDAPRPRRYDDTNLFQMSIRLMDAINLMGRQQEGRHA